MSQRTTGWRSIFSIPRMYQLAQGAIGSPSVRSALAQRVGARASGSILDIGCGTGEMLDYFSQLNYVGFDLSAPYIQKANDLYGDRGRFFVRDVNDDVSDLPLFDHAIAKGVLHHLDDASALALFRGARNVLREGGQLVTVDPCFSDGQSRIARFLIEQDRGTAVRTAQRYRDLAEQVFSEVQVSETHDLLRVPYSHAFLRCTA